MNNYHYINHTCPACGQVIDGKQKNMRTQNEILRKCVQNLCLIFTVMACIYLFIFVVILIHSLFIRMDELNDDGSLSGVEESWDGLLDEGSWEHNHKRILLIDCFDTEFGCCQSSTIEKINKDGVNCHLLYRFHNEIRLLVIVFIILCICGRIVET